MRLEQRLIIFVIAAFLMSACTASTEHPSAESPDLHPSQHQSSDVPLFGVETSRNVLGRSDVVQTRAAELGTFWLRLNSVRWDEVQPTPDSAYDWSVLSGLEADLAMARELGMEPTVIIRGSPHWATVFPSNCAAVKEESFPAFAAFIEALVTRYRDQVQYWEFGNEPDADPRLVAIDQVYGCWGNIDDPYYGGEHYGRMLQAVAPAVRRANPNAQIVIGGMMLDRPETTDPTKGKPERFFEGILRSGAADSFDIVAFHSYPFFARLGYDHDLGLFDPEIIVFDDRWGSLGGFSIGKVKFLREVMDRYDVEKPLWLNEAGLVCHSRDDHCDPELPEHFQAQADHIVRLVARAAAHDVRMVTWYTLNGPGWRGAGLLDRSQEPRPAFVAYRHMVATLQGYQYVGPIDYGQSDTIEGYRFHKDATVVDLLWSKSTITHTVTLPADQVVSVTTLDGTELSPSLDATSDGTIELFVGFDPVYIERRK